MQNQHMKAAYERRAKICAFTTNMHVDKNIPILNFSPMRVVLLGRVTLRTNCFFFSIF